MNRLTAITLFLIAIINKLISCKQLPTAVIARIFFQVASHIKEKFDLLHWILRAFKDNICRAIILTKDIFSTRHPLQLIPINSRQIVDFIVTCRTLRVGVAAENILKKILDNVHRLHTSNLEVVMLLLLEGLTASLPSQIRR
jgi:hypothetical protein